MRGKRLTEEQRAELLKVYLTGDSKAAKALAAKIGVHEHYLSLIARRNGHFNNYGRIGRVAPKPSQPNDPRWKWAIERGPVIA